MNKLPKCNYPYESLKAIFIAGVSLMVDDNKLTMDEAKSQLSTILGLLKICEEDKATAQKLLTMGKNAMSGAKQDEV